MDFDRFDPDPAVELTHRRLITEGVLEPLALGGPDERVWTDCDLASLAENRLGERPDPDAWPGPLDADRRARWISRVTTGKLATPSARELERCYWLLEQDRRAGTVALATSSRGREHVRLSSLYVFPRERGRGVARRALAAIRDVLGEHERGLRLETEWTWQRTLGFYLHIQMWVRMWKRDIELWSRAGEPVPAIEIGDRLANLSVEIEHERIVLAHAERDGDRLARFEGTSDEPLAHEARSTLAVALATRGWPLLADPEAWKPGWHGDSGNPAGLADRIVYWEASARDEGWRVDTPRIPGLSYPTWSELQAR